MESRHNMSGQRPLTAKAFEARALSPSKGGDSLRRIAEPVSVELWSQVIDPIYDHTDEFAVPTRLPPNLSELGRVS